MTDPGFGYGLTAAAERDWSWIKGTVNAGYRGNSSALEREHDYRRKLIFTASLAKPLGPKSAVRLKGSRLFTLRFNSAQNSSELQAGALWRFDPDWAAAFGASFGTTNEVSNANHRFLASLRFSPTFGTASPDARLESSFQGKGSDQVGVHAASPSLAPELAVLERDEIIASASSAVMTLPSAKQVLKDVASLILQELGHISEIRTEGHTNELGPELYNLRLSQRRATAVVGFLVVQGVENQILHAEGFGKRRPKPGSEKLPQEERLTVNRRVEVIVHRPPGDEHAPRPWDEA